MKLRYINLILAAAMTIQFLSFAPQEGSAQIHVNFQIFYDELSPYGRWIRNDRLGYVWSPSLGRDFFPYGTNGYWVYTESGWTWFSSFPWGWAPFHYGRWFYDDFYGWLWVPDYEWAPAWVIWRSCEGYYGWTPWEPGIDIYLAFGNNYHHDHQLWRFVRKREMGRKDMSLHFSGLGQYMNLLSQSKIIENRRVDQSNNIIYHAGPFKSEVEKQTGRKVSPALIGELSTPEQKMKKDRMWIYRPQFSSESDINKDVSPKKSIEWKREAPEPAETREQHHPVKALQNHDDIQAVPQRTEPPRIISPVIAPPRPQQPDKDVLDKQPHQIKPDISIPRIEKPDRPLPVSPEPRKEPPAIQRPLQQPKEIKPSTLQREPPQLRPAAPAPRNQQPEKRILPPDNKPLKPKIRQGFP